MNLSLLKIKGLRLSLANRWKNGKELLSFPGLDKAAVVPEKDVGAAVPHLAGNQGGVVGELVSVGGVAMPGAVFGPSIDVCQSVREFKGFGTELADRAVQMLG